MSEICQHVICNIAATAAIDSNQSLFFDSYAQLCEIQIPSFDERNFKTVYITNNNLWENCIEKAPLIRGA